MDIDGWLRGIGLEQYAQTFRDNAIDADVLRDLTDDHLRELGLPLGARLKLLRAVVALGTSEQPPVSPEITPTAPRTDAERRQLTVMFVDLVGSTALSARLDPEDMREIVAAYHHSCAEQITKAGGFVAKYMGDGVLAYFGYPQAHEHDAERAVLAALALVEAVPKLSTMAGSPLQVRIGIATGLVVVGDLIGMGAAQERAVVGDTPNLAARLQALAEPNMVVIADSTRRLLGNLFELKDLGPRDLKGIAGPARAWAALQASSVASRFDALHTTGLTALVGREEESELLLRRWSRAKRGEGQVVLLSGEAGIGKSRLTAALLERLSGEAPTRLRYFCSPQHTDSVFYPIISQIERAAGLAHDDKPQAKLDKLDAILAQTSTSPQDAALFAEMLSLPNDGRYPVLELAPQQRRQRTLEALTAQLAELARQQPVLMIFEDAHWVDPTSLEVLGRTVDRIKTLRALLIVTFRPEFTAPWVGQSHVTSVTLNRLGEREAAAIIARLAGNKALPADVMVEIVERTDGIPLFVEEMTKAVLEAESEGAARRTVAAVPSPALAVPASLHASLMARLDRLGPAKEVAQIGSAIGREFSHALLASVARKPAPELGSALDHLIQAGLLFRQGVPPHATYLFKHALVQDAAYSLLLRGPRRTLHARIARALEEQFPQVTETQPEILAHHLTQAGMSAEAVDFWTRAGVLARGRSAFVEAGAHLRRGLELLLTLPESDTRAAQELPIQIALGQVHMATKGYGSAEAASAYHRAQELSKQINDSEQLMRVFISLRTLNQVQGKPNAAMDYGSRCLEIAQQKSDRIYLAQANAGLAHTLCIMGSFVLARRHICDALVADDPPDNPTHLAISGYTPRIFCLGIAGWNEWFLGYPDQSLSAALEAVTLARQIGFPQGIEQALNSAAHVHLLRHEPDAAIEMVKSALVISREQGFRMRIAMLRLLRGWALSLRGDHREALAELSEGLDEYEATGARAWRSNYLAILANGYLRAGMTSEGLSTLAKAREVAENQDERWWSAELLRVEGDLFRASRGAQAGDVERCYVGALAKGREQQAKSWELRASTSLARLWRDQGKCTEARDLLAPIYGWFTEGFNTLDLKQAKALLDELGA